MKSATRNPQSAIGKALLKNHFHGQLQKVGVGYFAGNRLRREIAGTLMEKFCLVKIKYDMTGSEGRNPAWEGQEKNSAWRRIKWTRIK
jgi:hypothetical protein